MADTDILNALERLSYHTLLRPNLRHSLGHFEKKELLQDIQNALLSFMDLEKLQILQSFGKLIPFAYRVKAMDSVILKYNRYGEKVQVERVYNDLLGIRFFCNDYSEIDKCTLFSNSSYFKKSDMRKGKGTDDGYRGIHYYYQQDHSHYPIEIQVNTRKDYLLNAWLHDNIYKREDIDVTIGSRIRAAYETGQLKTPADFQRMLEEELCHIL